MGAPGAAALVAAADAGGAARPASNPLDKLALNDPDATLAPRAAAVQKGHSKEAAAKPSRAGGGASAKSTVAHAEAAPARKAHKNDDDADTELVAAIIARLDRRGAAPSQAGAGGAARDDNAALSAVVRKCDAKTDPLDARRCRSKACDKRWGKADACPSSRAPKGSSAAGVGRGQLP